MIELRVNGTPVTLDIDPAERLLDVLRYRLDLTGTKEGCGEGECGACTVYLSGLPVDACLVPAYQAEGQDVRTIESLDEAELGPFLRTGATQCGACTPGVVMTGVWIRDHPDVLESHNIRDMMAGNLCRCTGYDGIVEGVEAALASPAPGRGEARSAGASRAATDPPRPRPAAYAAVRGEGRVHRPASLDEALEMLAGEPDAVPIAGATDLLVHWPARLDAHDDTYVDLTRLDELRGHIWAEDELRLGGLSTYWDIVSDARAERDLPLLVEAARQVGAVQIQARGTWAGNIANASPAADGVPVLMAYGATVVLASTDGEEEVPLDEFYLDYKRMRMRPGQLIVGIRVPRNRYDIAWFDKVGPRAAQAITKVGVAVTRRADGGADGSRWRVVANSAAPTVRRCSAVEALLAGGESEAPSLASLKRALASDVSPIDDVRSKAEYRRRVLARLLHFGLRRRLRASA